MEKIYMVFEGTYDDGHYYGTTGFDETLTAIYMAEELAQKHLAL